jgi:Family of unknown function (DUF6788)
MKNPISQLEQKRQRVLQKVPELTEMARGRIVERYLRCGQPNCRCKKPGEQGHGPYHYLVVTVGPGKSRTQLLSRGQLRRVRRWTDNFKRLRQALEQITELNYEILKLERQAEKATKSRGSREGGR